MLLVRLEALRLPVPFGVLDLATVDEFLRWARSRIRSGTRADVVLDLSEVEFLMAAGVQALLDLDADLACEGRTLAVVGAAPIVVRVLDICGYGARWSLT